MKIEDIIFGYDKKHSHGSAQWADYTERRKVLKTSNKGIYIANNLRLSLEASNAHIGIIAPTRAGKTSRYILTNSLSKFSAPSGFVYFDPSREIRQKSEKWLKKQGYDVRFFDLEDFQASEQINFLDFVQDKNSARMMAQAIIDQTFQDSKDDAFWTEGSISLITLLFLAVVREIPVENRTLSFVYQLVNKLGHSQDEVSALMEIALDDADFDEYAAFLANSEKIRLSLLATIRSSLYSFSDPVLQHICARTTFDFLSLRKRKTVLFIHTREDKIPFYKAFFSVFFQQLFEALMLGEGNQVFLMLDEFASYHIPNFHRTISVIAKRRVSISVILQSIQQLEVAYGKEKAQIILDNLNSKIILPGLPAHSAEIVSRSLGMGTELYTQKSTDFFDTTTPKHRVSRQLMSPDEVRTLEEGYCLFLQGRYRPMKLKMTPYYKRRKLVRRTKL